MVGTQERSNLTMFTIYRWWDKFYFNFTTHSVVLFLSCKVKFASPNDKLWTIITFYIQHTFYICLKKAIENFRKLYPIYIS